MADQEQTEATAAGSIPARRAAPPERTALLTKYLLVMLGYAVVAGVISSLLGWFRTPRGPVSAETEIDATAMTSAAVAAPP